MCSRFPIATSASIRPSYMHAQRHNDIIIRSFCICDNHYKWFPVSEALPHFPTSAVCLDSFCVLGSSVSLWSPSPFLITVDLLSSLPPSCLHAQAPIMDPFRIITVTVNDTDAEPPSYSSSFARCLSEGKWITSCSLFLFPSFFSEKDHSHYLTVSVTYTKTQALHYISGVLSPGPTGSLTHWWKAHQAGRAVCRRSHFSISACDMQEEAASIMSIGFIPDSNCDKRSTSLPFHPTTD